MSRATCGADLGLNQGSRPTRACKVKNVLDSNQNQGQDQSPSQNRGRNQAQAQGQIQGPSGIHTSTNANNISNVRKRKSLVRTSDRLRIKQRREEQTRKAKAALRLETHGVLHRDIAIEYGNSANINHKALFLNRLGLRPKSGPRILEYQRVHFKPESLKSIANAVYAVHRVGLGFGKSAISNIHNNNTNRVRCPKVVEVDLTGCSDDDEDNTKTNYNANSSSSTYNSIDLKLSHAASNHSRDLTHNVFHEAADTSRRKGGGAGNVAFVPVPGLQRSSPSINPNSVLKSLPNKLRKVGVGTVVSEEVSSGMSPSYARQVQQQQILQQQSYYSKNNQPTQTQTMQNKQMPGLVVVQKQHPSSISSFAPSRALPSPVSLNLETNSDAWHQKLNKLRNNINTNCNLQESMKIAGVQNQRGSQNQFRFKEPHQTRHLGTKLPNQSVPVPVPVPQKTSPHPKLTPKPQRVQIGPISNLYRQHLPVSSTIHHHAIVNAGVGVGSPSPKANSSPIHRLPNRPVRPVRNRNVPAPAPAPALDPVRVSALQLPTPLVAQKFSSPHEANDIQIVDLSSSDDDNDEHTEQRKDNNLDQIRNRLLAMDTDLSFID